MSSLEGVLLSMIKTANASVTAFHVWLQIQGYEIESQPSPITFGQADLEIISMTILPLQLIQEGQLTVS